MSLSDGAGPTLLLPYSLDNLARGVPNWSATSDGVTTWVPPRAPDLWGHPPLECPSCSRAMHASHVISF